MKVFHTISPLVQYLDEYRGKSKTIGFVPTMGALHAGHISLIEESVRHDDLTVVSIFVNPNQFNNPDDLKRYPRNPDSDIVMCKQAGASVVFMPSVEVIYPEPDKRQFDFGILDKVMEGKFRPGHFNGVAQVVSRLFDIVKPNRAYFGQKDFQQLAIIKRMVWDYSMDVEIIPCPTVRESDGLAMSSRNTLLTPQQRASAPLISKILFEARNKAHSHSVDELLAWVVDSINQDPLLRVEYFSIVNAVTLEEITQWSDAENVVGCIAVNVGAVRLIDNVLFLTSSNNLEMLVEVVKSKIHQVKVTEANLYYVGSIAIDEDLMDAANIIANEKVQVVNINNGERVETYVIKGKRGSGEICLNGPAARKCVVGDVVIIMAYALMDFEEAKTFKPAIVFPDTETNRLV